MLLWLYMCDRSIMVTAILEYIESSSSLSRGVIIIIQPESGMCLCLSE